MITVISEKLIMNRENFLLLTDSWADESLTYEEEAGLKHGRENIKNCDFMTLSEL